MITSRDEITGALIYIKSKEDLEKERISNKVKDSNRKLMELEQMLIELEPQFKMLEEINKKMKSMEKRVAKIEKNLKDFIIDDGE